MQLWLVHSILWASILASAGVALVTTLLVEYLAKPWLEVRKDRILENSRARRKAVSGLAESDSLMFRLMASIDKAAPIIEPADQMAKDLRNHVVFADTTIRVPRSIGIDWNETVFALRAFAFAFYDGRPTSEVLERYETTSRRLKYFQELFNMSRWHLLRRYKLMREIRSLPLPPPKVTSDETIASMFRKGYLLSLISQFLRFGIPFKTSALRCRVLSCLLA
jgi:hypothetical protein